MTIEEAIKHNEELSDCLLYSYRADHKLALKLGIEALKARKVWQDNEGFDPAEALPGETPPEKET